jgi:hypothetical protein
MIIIIDEIPFIEKKLMKFGIERRINSSKLMAMIKKGIIANIRQTVKQTTN